MDALWPIRQTEHMRIGRASESGALYFVTLVTERREPWLLNAEYEANYLGVLRRWHDERDGKILAATVMPDHAHVLFQLGTRLTVGQTIARWKSETRKCNNFAHSFQRDFWEHRIRPSEAMEDYALYIFLNPYRAGLCPADSLWTSWWAPDPALFLFWALLDPSGGPPQEWIEWPQSRFAQLAHGE